MSADLSSQNCVLLLLLSLTYKVPYGTNIVANWLMECDKHIYIQRQIRETIRYIYAVQYIQKHVAKIVYKYNIADQDMEQDKQIWQQTEDRLQCI